MEFFNGILTNSLLATARRELCFNIPLKSMYYVSYGYIKYDIFEAVRSAIPVCVCTAQTIL